MALMLLVWDAGVTGSFLFSLIVCPIWLLASILRNMIERPVWRLALWRTAIPVITLALVLMNNAVQARIAETNASRIIAACETFRAEEGRYPKTLDELTPQYVPSVPRAKYCGMWDEFLYWNNDGRPRLCWYAVPPHGRKLYDFANRKWKYLD